MLFLYYAIGHSLQICLIKVIRNYKARKAYECVKQCEVDLPAQRIHTCEVPRRRRSFDYLLDQSNILPTKLRPRP
jgi:hypothetical protein